MSNVGGGASITNINNNALFQVDFWSAYQEEVAATAGGTNLSLPSIVVANIPATATVIKVIAFFKARMIENTNAAANKLSGAQNIQVKLSTVAAYTVAAIALVDDLLGIAASTREPGDVLMGTADISAVVTGNGTYNFQWTAATVDQNNLNFNDVQVGLRVWYSV